MNIFKPDSKTSLFPPAQISGLLVNMLRGIDMPRMIYGTAWKRDRTKDLVIEAVKAGFRGIDAAAKPKNYNEKLAGAGLVELIDQGYITREQLFIQTKFSPMSKEDAETFGCPYNINGQIPEQIFQSFQDSLANFRTDYIDSYILHEPYATDEENTAAWRTLERLVHEKKVKRIGLSNIYSSHQFNFFWKIAEIKPTVLQNKFNAEERFHFQFKEFCKQGVTFQSYGTLTANHNLLAYVNELEQKPNNLSPEQVLFKYVQQLGIVPLNGTSSSTHMKMDLAVENLLELPVELTHKIDLYIGKN